VRLAPPAERDPLSRGPWSLGHRVDLDLSRSPITEAFRFLADAAHVNVVLGDDIDGEVTLRLRRVTIRDALRAVAATQSLETEWRGDILWIRRGDGVE
jgi:type II secretory pathway component HofQ